MRDREGKIQIAGFWRLRIEEVVRLPITALTRKAWQCDKMREKMTYFITFYFIKPLLMLSPLIELDFL